MSEGVSVFQQGNSIMHRLDPRTKLMLLFCSFALVMLFNHPVFVGAVYVLNLIMAFSSGIPFRVIKGTLTANIFVFLLSVLIWPLYVQDGAVLFSLLGIPYTLNALLYGCGVGFRLITMMTASTVFIANTPPYKLIAALQQLRMPPKACLVASMMIRFVPAITNEAKMIVEAQKSRGLDFESGGIAQKVKKYAPITIPLFMRSFTIARRLSLAMDARAYGINPRPTPYITFVMNTTDKIFIAMGIGLLIIGVFGRITGFATIIPGLL